MVTGLSRSVHLDNSFISLLSAEESCYFKAAVLIFFFALVLSILPEAGLEVKEFSYGLQKYWKNQNLLCFWELMPSMAQGCLHCIYDSIQKAYEEQNDKKLWKEIAFTDLILSRVFSITAIPLSEISLKQQQGKISTMMKFNHPSFIGMFCQRCLWPEGRPKITSLPRYYCPIAHPKKAGVIATFLTLFQCLP